MNKKNFYFFSLAFLTVCLQVIYYSDFIFGAAVFETGDFAANALQIYEAKRFNELYGNYSRWEFYHPGPVFFYIYSFGEFFFYDSSFLNSPHQAHVLTGVFLQGIFYLWAIKILYSYFSNINFLLILIALTLLGGIYAHHMFISIWAPHVLLMPFLLLLVSFASVIEGNYENYIPLVLSSCFLVHGHVAQPLFVFTLFFFAFAYSIYSVNDKRRLLRVNSFFNKTMIICITILIVFLSPLFIDILQGDSSNFIKYINHIESHSSENKTTLQSIAYFFSFINFDQYPEKSINEDFNFLVIFKNYGIMASGWIIVGLISLYISFSKKNIFKNKEFAKTLNVGFILTCLLSIYWGVIMDGPMFSFNAYFNYSILFIPFIVPVYYLVLLGNKKMIPIVLIGLVMTILFFFSKKQPIQSNTLYGKIIEQNVKILVQEQEKKKYFIDFPSHYWPTAISIALALKRLNNEFYVNDEWGYIFGVKNTLGYHKIYNKEELSRLIIMDTLGDVALHLHDSVGFLLKNPLFYSFEYGEGWGEKEGNAYRWSNDELSTIKLINIKEDKKRTLWLKLKGNYFNPIRNSKLYIGERQITEIYFDNNGEQIISIEVDGKSDIILSIKHFDIRSPKELNISEDSRKLKLNLPSIVIYQD